MCSFIGSKEDEMSHHYNDQGSIFISQKTKTLERSGTNDSDYYSLRVSCNIHNYFCSHFHYLTKFTLIDIYFQKTFAFRVKHIYYQRDRWTG